MELNIPSFALHRFGTVIVRVKMEVATRCCKPEGLPMQDCPEMVHRISSCEQCIRTRNCRCSDSDSVVGNCRPYTASSARSRYVNVCAAVCLLLLVGGLTPTALAAPHWIRMDRDRRATNEENQKWANPCDYSKEPMNNPAYTSDQARAVSVQASSALSRAQEYKNEIAKLHGYSEFEKMHDFWKAHKYLRKLENTSWFLDEVLPRNKVHGQRLKDSEIDQIMAKIDEVLPSMYKGLKVLVAGLFAISDQVNMDSSIINTSLQDHLRDTGHNVRAVLCLFNDVMRGRNLKILPLLDSELPNFNHDDRVKDAYLIYRDTLNYLEYLDQLFDKMSQMSE